MSCCFSFREQPCDCWNVILQPNLMNSRYSWAIFKVFWFSISWRMTWLSIQYFTWRNWPIIRFYTLGRLDLRDRRPTCILRFAPEQRNRSNCDWLFCVSCEISPDSSVRVRVFEGRWIWHGLPDQRWTGLSGFRLEDRMWICRTVLGCFGDISSGKCGFRLKMMEQPGAQEAVPFEQFSTKNIRNRGQLKRISAENELHFAWKKAR